jgi:hypothetical protein
MKQYCDRILALETTWHECQMERLLRTAGIESAPMDPSLMDALQQLVNERQLEPKPKPSPAAAAFEDRKLPAAYNPEVRSTLNVASSGHSVAMAPTTAMAKAKAPPTTSSTTTTSSYSSNATATATPTSPATDRGILEQLEFQTSLLLDMQRKLEALNAKVERLEGRSGSGSAASEATNTYSYTNSRYYHIPRAETAKDERQQQQQQQQQRAPPFAAAAPPPVHNGVDNARNLEPAAEPAESFLRRLFFPIFFLWDALSQSQVALITRELWVQSGNHVVPLDGALLFKIMFMLLVVSARMSRTTTSSGKHNLRFYISMALMLVEFLWHTRYLQFMYRFFVQDNVPWWIWNEGFGMKEKGMGTLQKQKRRLRHHRYPPSTSSSSSRRGSTSTLQSQ